MFAEEFLPANAQTIGNILSAVDKKLTSLTNDIPEPVSLPDSPPSDELLKQLELLKYENETLKAHLTKEIEG